MKTSEKTQDKPGHPAKDWNKQQCSFSLTAVLVY
jgi:hypothetical protein